MDALSELTYDQTPYHFGFNNPVFWSDPTGLFAQYFQAVIFALSLDGNSTITYNGGLAGWVVTVEGGKFDGASFYDYEATGTIMDEMIIPASRGGGAIGPKSSKMQGMFTLWGDNSKDMIPGNKRSEIVASIERSDVYQRGAGSSLRRGTNFWKRLQNWLSGMDSRSGLVENTNNSNATTEEQNSVEKHQEEVVKIVVKVYSPENWWDSTGVARAHSGYVVSINKNDEAKKRKYYRDLEIQDSTHRANQYKRRK